MRIPPFERGHNDAASYLEMMDRQSQSTMLADQVNKSFHNPAWNVPWASWHPPSTHRIFATDIGRVTALVVAQRQGRTVIVSGSDDKSIRICDLERGLQLGKHLTGHTGTVTALVVAQRQGRTVIVSGSLDKSIRIWDLEREQQLRKPLTGHSGRVAALTVAQRQGRTVIVSGSENSIRIWDLERGLQLGKPLTGHTNGVTALAVAQRQVRTVIISGSWDNSIRIWDLGRVCKSCLMDNAPSWR
jgi:WD40 repeat protein